MYIHLLLKQKTRKMKKLIVLASCMAIFITLQATPPKTSNNAVTWQLDKSHSGVKFSVDHLVISETEGSFKIFDGSLTSPGEDFEGSQVSFSVDVNSINTDDEKRDQHLKSDDFFNAAQYPVMKFKSTSFTKVKDNAYVLEGDLTIRDITKKVRFAVIYGGTIQDPWGNTKAGFKASGKISRKDFGLKWNTVTEAGGAVVGDEVRMQVNVEFAQAK